MLTQSISLPAINLSQTLTDRKQDRSQIIKSIIHQCQDMSKDMSKQINEFSVNESRIDRAFDNFEKFIDYKQEAWYDTTPIQVIKELQGEKYKP